MNRLVIASISWFLRDFNRWLPDTNGIPNTETTEKMTTFQGWVHRFCPKNLGVADGKKTLPLEAGSLSHLFTRFDRSQVGYIAGLDHQKYSSWWWQLIFFLFLPRCLGGKIPISTGRFNHPPVLPHGGWLSSFSFKLFFNVGHFHDNLDFCVIIIFFHENTSHLVVVTTKDYNPWNLRLIQPFTIYHLLVFNIRFPWFCLGFIYLNWSINIWDGQFSEGFWTC